MKTANTNLSDKEAQAQLKRFSTVGLLCSIIGIVIFWWLGILAIGFGARAIVLSNHKANKGKKDTRKYLIMGIASLVIGIIEVVMVNLNSFNA